MSKREDENVEQMETGRGWDRPQRDSAAIWRVPVYMHIRANDLTHAKEIARAGMNTSIGIITGLVGFELGGEESDTLPLHGEDLSTDWVLVEALGSYFRLDQGTLIGAPATAQGVNMQGAVALNPQDYAGQERSNLRQIRRDLLDRAKAQQRAEFAGEVTVEGKNEEAVEKERKEKK